MILKIKAANGQAEQSWRFFDAVEGLYYSVYKNNVARGVEETIADVQYVQFWDNSKESIEEFNYVELCFYSELTGNIEIQCNTTVYLLNDRGQTIERVL